MESVRHWPAGTRPGQPRILHSDAGNLFLMKMWNPLKQIAAQLSRDDMELLGIDRTMRLAKKMNRLRYGRYQRRRDRDYRAEFDRLLAGHAHGSLPQAT